MRAALHGTEWDEVWDGYDQALPKAEPDQPVPQPDLPKARPRGLLALVALALAMPTPLLSGEDTLRGIPREALFSLSPVETQLPPVDVALARLAAESAGASCWAAQLRPQGSNCAVPAAGR